MYSFCTIFNIFHSPIQLIILLVTEYLHRSIIVEKNTHVNGVAADAVGSSVYIRLTFLVQNKPGGKECIDQTVREGNNYSARFLIAAAGIGDTCKGDVRQL